MSKTPQFKTLEKELQPYKNLMQKAVEVIEVQDVSNYPILVVHLNTVDIGINIVDKDKIKGKWSINASTLEEFVAKQIIADEKIEDFKILYKTHSGDLCLFVLSETGANFVFLPK
jgi:hypothetical protein